MADSGPGYDNAPCKKSHSGWNQVQRDLRGPDLEEHALGENAARNPGKSNCKVRGRPVSLRRTQSSSAIRSNRFMEHE